MVRSLRSLRSFVTAAELRSVTRAAHELSYSQPAVSLHLRALERDLGCVLFERSPAGLLLTDEGALCLTPAREVLRLCDEIVDLAHPPRRPSGPRRSPA